MYTKMAEISYFIFFKESRALLTFLLNLLTLHVASDVFFLHVNFLKEKKALDFKHLRKMSHIKAREICFGNMTTAKKVASLPAKCLSMRPCCSFYRDSTIVI